MDMTAPAKAIPLGQRRSVPRDRSLDVSALDIDVATSSDQLPTPITRRLTWLTRGSLAVADQGIFAGSHFLFNIMLARWLTPSGYGVFALAYSIFLLLLTIHSAIFTAPMLVFGAGKYRQRFNEYIGLLVRGHFILLLAASVVITAAAMVIGLSQSTAVGKALLALAITTPFLLLMWLLRRAFYACLRPGYAAAAGVLYLLIILPGAVGLHSVNRLTPLSAIYTLGVGSLVVSSLLIVILRPRWSSEVLVPRDVAWQHWRYGRWLLASAPPSWICDQIYYVVLPASAGLEYGGALKALLNLVMPVLQTLSALGVLLMPTLISRRISGGFHAMVATFRLSLMLFMVICTGTLLVLLPFRSPILHYVYGGRYSDFPVATVILLSLYPFTQCLSIACGSLLSALEKPQLVFRATLAGSFVALGIGIPLAVAFPIDGALWGLALSYSVMGALMLRYVGWGSYSVHPIPSI